ncbi:MAG: TonB family protein [Acidobacteria bacterium]|nr:MAG: TonB family protein [Acidobacteriota bacterium]
MSYQPLWLRDLVAYSIQAAALVGAGAMMASLLRLRLPRVRLAYWQALLAVCVFLPLLQPWRPEVLEISGSAWSDVTLAPSAAAAAPSGPSLAEIVLWLVCAGIVLRLAWIAMGLGRLWLYRRRAKRIEKLPQAVEEAHRLAPASPAFFISRQIQTPATFGFFRPAVLFPARFLEMEAAMQKAIALHELLHVERCDWLWNMLEEMVLTLLWFHLPLWWVVRSARLSREQVVDAEAVRRSNERGPYLKALLEMAGRRRLAANLPAPLFLRESQLAERVALMMKEVHMSRTRLMVSILTAAVTLLIAGATLAWAFPLKTSELQAESHATSSAPAANGDGTYRYQGKDYKFPGKFYEVGGNVYAPEAINNPDPPYTPQARKSHLSGTIVFAVVVDAGGKVAGIQQLSRPLGQGLDESAIRTIRSWKFKPGTRDGIPVPVRVQIEINFRLYGKSTEASRKANLVSDPPAQENLSASTNTDNNRNVQFNQNDIRRQVNEAMKQVQMAQHPEVKIDEAKIQEQIDQAMKQLKMAEVQIPKIDQEKISQEIEQAMKQAQVAQDVAPKIDQKKLQEQIDQAMEQLKKMNTPEMRRHMDEAMKQLEKMNTPEMRQHLKEQMDQLKKMNMPEMRRQLEQAMAQAKIAQEGAPRIDREEMKRQLDEARKQAAQARQEAQAARKEAAKARQEAKEARREAEEQRNATKPTPPAAPKPAPPAPKGAAPSPQAAPVPPALPKTPESARIIGGVPGGVVGGVAGRKVTGVQGGQVKGIEGGHVIGVPGGITGGVVTAPRPPVPPSTSPNEAAPTSPPAPSAPPQN